MSGSKSQLRGEVLRELVGYTLASGTSLAVDYGSYWALATLGRLPLPTAAACGYTIGLAVAYGLLARFVYLGRSRWTRRWVQVAMFGSSGLVGITLTYMTVWAYTSVLGQHVLQAKVASMGVSFVAVYVFRRTLVFAPSSAPPAVLDCVPMPEQATPGSGLPTR